MSLDRLDLVMSKYRPGLPGGVPRVGQAALDDWPTLGTFGAKGDGSADDSDAIEEALNSGRGIRITAGHYHCTRKIAYTGPVNFIGENADRSNIIFDGCDGFELTTRDDTEEIRPAVFEHLSIKSTGAGVYKGLKLNGRSWGFGKQLLVRDCSFIGSDHSKCWNTAIHLIKGGNVEIHGTNFIGRHDNNEHWATMAYGIYAEDVSTDVKVCKNYFYMIDTCALVNGQLYTDGSGVHATNAGEGWTVSDNHFVLVNNAFWTRNNSGTMFVIYGNHVASKLRGFIIGTENVIGSNHSFIHNNFLTKRDDSAENWVGIECNAAHVKITDNDIRTVVPLPGGATAITVSGSYCTVAGNAVCDSDTGIWIKSGGEGAVVYGNSGTNNTVNMRFDTARYSRGINRFDDEPNAPRGCFIFKNNSTAMSGAYATVPFDAKIYDNDNIWDAGGRFYARAAGWYKVRAQIIFSPSPDGTSHGHAVKIAKNGVQNWIGMGAQTVVGDGPGVQTETPWVFMSENEYFEVLASQHTPGSVSASPYSWVEIQVR